MRQGIPQRCPTHLGTAPTAQGLFAQGLDQPGCPLSRQCARRGHGQVTQPVDEISVDPVFPRPHHRAAKGYAMAFSEGCFSSERNQLEIIGLWPEPAQAGSGHCGPQIVKKNRGLPDRKHAGLGARALNHMRAITDGKNTCIA